MVGMEDAPYMLQLPMNRVMAVSINQMLVKGPTGNSDMLEVPRYHDMVAMKTKERAITNEKPLIPSRTWRTHWRCSLPNTSN